MQKGKKSTILLVTLYDHSIYIHKEKIKDFPSTQFIFFSGVQNLGLISSSWLALLPLSFPVSSFYYPEAKVHSVSNGFFDWYSEGK